MSLLRAVLFSFLVVMLINHAETPLRASNGDPEDVGPFMRAYFQALSGGDVNTLIQMLGEPLLNHRRILLEKNTAYPDHLRSYYQDVRFVIRAITSTKPAEYIVSAEFIFPSDGQSILLKFFLERVEGQLNIVNEISDE